MIKNFIIFSYMAVSSKGNLMFALDFFFLYNSRNVLCALWSIKHKMIRSLRIVNTISLKHY